MSYVASTFYSGEIPTTAIWNQLWANDASFNDGSGFGAGIFAYTHLLPGTISSQIVSGSNPGSGGGTVNSLQLAGLLMAWGITQRYTVSGTPSGVTGQSVNWPFSFNSVAYFSCEAFYFTNTPQCYAYFEGIPSGSGVTFGCRSAVSNTFTVNWLVIGT